MRVVTLQILKCSARASSTSNAVPQELHVYDSMAGTYVDILLNVFVFVRVEIYRKTFKRGLKKL